jgi:hypothetical protein
MSEPYVQHGLICLEQRGFASREGKNPFRVSRNASEFEEAERRACPLHGAANRRRVREAGADSAAP